MERGNGGGADRGRGLTRRSLGTGWRRVEERSCVAKVIMESGTKFKLLMVDSSAPSCFGSDRRAFQLKMVQNTCDGRHGKDSEYLALLLGELHCTYRSCP